MKFLRLLLSIGALCAIQNSYAQYCTVGKEEWVAGCEAACTASWEGKDCPRSCTATPPPGFVITNHRVHVRSQNNGGHDVSRISADQKFDYQRKVEEAYSSAMEAAAKAGNKGAEAKLRDEMRYAISEAEKFSSSHQLIRLSVNASKHGSVIDRKRGWSKVGVEVLVKCVVPQDLEKQLMRRYALQ